MNVFSRTALLLCTNIYKVNPNQLRNFAKALSKQQVTLPNHETLTGRILLYLNVEQAERLKYSPEILKNVLQNRHNLRNLSTNELLTASNHLNNLNLSRNEVLSVLKQLDAEYCFRLRSLSNADILAMLNVYMSIIPNKIHEFRLYRQSVKMLFESVSSLNKKDFVQLIFYIGIKKKNQESQEMLWQCLRIMNHNFINGLTSEELCIICNATFKTSTKIINKKLLEKVTRYINDNLSVLSDTDLFITLVKTLRHNRFQTDDLLNTISYAMFFNKTLTLYSFPMICHIMALYADYFYYDDKLFTFLTKTCLEQLNESSFKAKEIHPSEQLRGKDIKRFLWVMSMFSEMKLLSHSDIKNVIMPKLIERINAREFDGDLDSLVDITLYLWMLNYQAEELVPYIFNKRTWNLLRINPKSNLRLNLLMNAIFIENEEIAKKLPAKPVEVPSSNISTYQLVKRPLVQRLLNNLQGMRKQLNLKKFELSQDIPHLNIVGITGYKDNLNKAVHVEVLDDYNMVKNVQDDVPVGLMALKLRLLDRSAEGVLVVSQKEMEEMTEKELNEYLLEEIKLIC